MPLSARQGGEEFLLPAGQAVLMDARSPSDLAGPLGTSFLGFRISRQWFRQFGLHAPEGAHKVLSSTPMALLCAYARRMAMAADLERSGLARLLETHVGELLAAALIAGRAPAPRIPA
jgi:hypothetical protein